MQDEVFTCKTPRTHVIIYNNKLPHVKYKPVMVRHVGVTKHAMYMVLSL